MVNLGIVKLPCVTDLESVHGMASYCDVCRCFLLQRNVGEYCEDPITIQKLLSVGQHGVSL